MGKGIRLLIATRNAGKLKELRHFLSSFKVETVSLKDIGIKEDIDETGETYQENSQKKALFFAKISGLSTIADDGGLEISALNNKPGIRSRRWLGYEGSDEELINHMTNVSKNLPADNRKAFFRTVISFALPNGKVWSGAGEIEGIIAEEPHLKHLKGYPYRSFFYLPKLKKYYHEDELTIGEMKKYNHRWKAIAMLKPIIARELKL